MRFTLSALKKYLKTDMSAEQLAGAMTLLGLEVEEVHDMRKPLDRFIVAEVVEETPHPDSDHLHLLKVDTGGGIIQVVCGAPNAKKGLIGILARPGDIIPESGEKLKKGNIRGQASEGMMCSERELGLGTDHDGIIELPAGAKAGEAAPGALAKTYTIDVVFEAEVTPNRPDYLGVIGIARDLAAGGYGEFIAPKIESMKGSFDCPVKIENKAPEFAKQFDIRYVRGVNNGPSPKWLGDYLNLCGGKAISALVDITNYCVVDICRPLHAFDADKVKGAITVGLAKGGEKFLALDGNEYTLAGGDIVIRDDTGVISLAGIMGGSATSCTPETKNVILESAYFDPVAIRRSAKRLGIESDAKYRFERGVDPASTEWGMEFATKIIIDICGGEASHVARTGANAWRAPGVEFPIEYFKRRIGIDMDKETMAGILKRLGCEVKEKGDTLLINPPSWRGDIAAKEDITEELIRIYGYDKLPENHVAADGMRPVLDARQSRRGAARRLLAARGLVEVYTWSFMSSAKDSGTDEPIRLANPITAELDIMRRSIIPNLLDGLAANAARSIRSAHIFEIAPVFASGRPGDQRLCAAGARCGNMREKDWSAPAAPVSAYDAKADALALLALYGIDAAKVRYSTDGLPRWAHPHRGAAISYGGKTVGYFGEVHPLALKKSGIKNIAAAAFEIDLDTLPEAAKKTPAKKKLALSEFQPIERDFAFVLEAGVNADEILRAARTASEAISAARIFDIYTGTNLGGKKSVALSVEIVPAGKTLTDAEIQAISDRIIANAAKLGGVLRDK